MLPGCALPQNRHGTLLDFWIVLANTRNARLKAERQVEMSNKRKGIVVEKSEDDKKIPPKTSPSTMLN